MTDEVGVITGDVTVRTEICDDRVHVQIQYTGAEEWYTLTGTPLPLEGRTERGARAAIMRAVRKGLPEGLRAGQLH
ncbi:hypothetical protein [Streptosporangium carneum]|nr:hypothetical protein [Streptosporangium carneum]